MMSNRVTFPPRGVRVPAVAGLVLAWTLCFGQGVGATIADRIATTTITLPAALEPRQNSWCTWGFCSSGLGPRLYHAPLASGKTLVGWSDASGNGHVSLVNGATIERTVDFASRPVRGLVGHDDGTFAVLLLDRRGAGVTDNMMVLTKRTAAGAEIWSRDLPDTSPFTAVPNPIDGAGYMIGDSRLAYGGGLYGAYFSVHTLPLPGHDGEQLAFVDDSGVIQPGGMGWLLSHGMAELIGYHPELGRMTRVGVSDCFPNPPGGGIYADATLSGGHLLYGLDFDCAGSVSGQLGQMAAASGSRWLVLFNAQQHGTVAGNGIGLARFGPDYVPTITWLTVTTGTEERDPVLARIGTTLGSDRFLAGWRMQTSGTYKLAVISAAGIITEAPEVVSPAVTWGNRDDSFRTRPDGRISWVDGAAGSTTLRLYAYTDVATGVASGGGTGGVAPAFPTAYPNPATAGASHIRFTLQAEGEVTIRIHDATGRLVRELCRGRRDAGAHDDAWDGGDDRGVPVPSGVYFYRLEAEGASRAGKLVVRR